GCRPQQTGGLADRRDRWHREEDAALGDNFESGSAGELRVALGRVGVGPESTHPRRQKFPGPIECAARWVDQWWPQHVERDNGTAGSDEAPHERQRLGRVRLVHEHQPTERQIERLTAEGVDVDCIDVAGHEVDIGESDTIEQLSRRVEGRRVGIDPDHGAVRSNDFAQRQQRADRTTPDVNRPTPWSKTRPFGDAAHLRRERLCHGDESVDLQRQVVKEVSRRDGHDQSPNIFTEYYLANIVSSMPAVNARPYRSPKRAEQAAATRMAILNAAGELFDGGGYVRTTTAAVARKAGVSEAMVFAAFGSKAGLVAGLINRAVTDGDESSELVATDAWSEAAASDDAMTAVRRFAKLTAAIQRRTWKLIELSRTASDGDPGMADLLRQGAQKRRSDCHNFISTAVANSLR